jgi:hypothetical protein
MTSFHEGNVPIEELERRWKTVSEGLRRPQNLLKPLNISLFLRDLRKSVFELERDNKSKPQRASVGAGNKTYSEKDVIEFWEEIKRRPDLQNNAKALKILGRESLYKGIHPILGDDLFIQLIKTRPILFFTPLWLRRYYFFFFDTLYLSDDLTITEVWGQVLGQCFEYLKKEGSLYRNGEIKVRYAPLVKTLSLTTTETQGLKPQLFEEYMETLLHIAPQKAMENIYTLEQYYRLSLGFDLLPSGIRRYCQKHLFNIHLSKYLNDIHDTVRLSNLLEQFCTLDTSIGQEHLVNLITEAYGGPAALKKLPQPLKNCIQGFLLKTIKDPRLNNVAWNSLRARNKPIYDSLRYWFVEADFDLFFEYAFRNSRDDHKRKELWSKFLKQAHDFRVFLPPYSHLEFRSLEKDENKHTQVYKNHDNITGFIMCIENLVIYEAVETGNAAYIYDLAELETKPSREANMVLRFLSHLFEKNCLLAYTGSRAALAHTNLAPRPEEWDGYNKSRRFTHDRNLLWHDQVLEYLKRYYLIVPDRVD